MIERKKSDRDEYEKGNSMTAETMRRMKRCCGNRDETCVNAPRGQNNAMRARPTITHNE